MLGIIVMNNDARCNVISPAFINEFIRVLNQFRSQHARAPQADIQWHHSRYR